MLIAQQIIVTATFLLHHRHQRLILHKICHSQPFVKLKVSKKFSWGPPFYKNGQDESAWNNCFIIHVYSSTLFHF